MTDRMANAPKLSVEEALKKLQRSDEPKSKKERYDEKMSALDEGIRRTRVQKLRLDRPKRTRD
ncbi:hypothetical protein FDV58_18115 [Bradyrhizobium elkanii]|uniref:Uncharacterized protein n=1 Tax=Bradyrhizobium elkanii TaxID=29448 RepID=A0A4U6RY36_BRAEL|nr:hypothetical protein [Bradyrhizobium elkanii]TKV80157.1 hypothetical protein FDV58_18115 [Bradyrhizobium elkanii]